MKISFHISPHASHRVAQARHWLESRAPAGEALVVAATVEAGNELLRSAANKTGAAFGWHRATMGRLAAELARAALVERNLAPIGKLGIEALVCRVVDALGAAGGLGRYDEIAQAPGFARATARTVLELRMAGAGPEKRVSLPSELAGMLETYERLLDEEKLADRASVFELATLALQKDDSWHPLAGLPTLLLDVPLWTPAEAALIETLAAHSPEVLATIPSGDTETANRLRDAGFVPANVDDSTEPATSLDRLAAELFQEGAPPSTALDDSVVLLSAPGEARECVEVARQLMAAAGSGIPFDRMAVLLRSVEEYRPHLEAAFARAGIPAHFARGTVAPDPAGRAFLALLASAAEGLSARRFAEYLSLGQVPDAAADARPPEAPSAGEAWVPPDEELVPEVVAEALEPPDEDSLPDGDEDAPAVAGTLRAPRRWERLLVDAAVIGGEDRWERRLAGLEARLRLAIEELEDPDGPEADRYRKQMEDLAAFGEFALPLVHELATLPQSATWGVWIERLSAFAVRALRSPDRVLAVVAELAPMSAVKGVPLREVQRVLSARLLEIARPPAKSRYGAVFVTAAEFARGMTFDVVAVPGLAEKLFPREIREDPILLDSARIALGLGLPTNRERVRRERLNLSLAVGSATRRVVLSYPRLDLEKARPRVPSFYGLEAFRAAEGRLPGFAELASRAESVVETRIGWPAPAKPEQAIDAAEHDLALLEALLGQGEDESAGTAAFLLGVNPHLARALRFRARRWLRRWTPVDGLVDPGAAAAAALGAHALDARSYSATALENYARCPYRFFLQAIQRLAPREVPEPIDELDALERGSLVHEVQFRLFRRLQDDGRLPVNEENLRTAEDLLDAVLKEVAGEFHEELRPAIERVWRDGIAAIRADLGEWLRRLAGDDSGYVPSSFERAFGLASARGRDPESQPDPLLLECGVRLRGSIDLIERHPDGRVRVTDHKTGKVRFPADGIVAGGSILQPVLYALAAEKLYPADTVTEGRLSYCTTAGGFEVRTVELDAAARGSAQALADAVSEALAAGFLPALPRDGECRFCDYRVVCGPYEEFRAGRKPADRDPVVRLAALRAMP